MSVQGTVRGGPEASLPAAAAAVALEVVCDKSLGFVGWCCVLHLLVALEPLVLPYSAQGAAVEASLASVPLLLAWP